jgi:hypothetical protein
MRSKSLFFIALAFLGCKNNPSYCDDATPCRVGLHCLMPAHQCVQDVNSNDLAAGGGGDMGPMPDLLACPACNNPTPICGAQLQCQACTSDTDCAKTTIGPHCLNGSCVACAQDSDCPSKICDLSPPLSSPTRGTCIDPAQVAYVDAAAAGGGDGSQAKPLKKIGDGVAKGKPYVHVAKGSYSELVSTSAKVFIVAETGTRLYTGMNSDTLTISDPGAVTVRNIRIEGGMGGRSAVNCGGANSTFTAYQSQFTGTSNAIYFDCQKLTLDGCWIDGAQQAGIYVNGGNQCNFDIENSLFTRNKNGAIYVTTNWTGSGTFASNTIADNTGSPSIDCQNARFVVFNSIVYKSGLSPMTTCDVDHVASDDAAITATNNGVTLAAAPFKTTGTRMMPDDWNLAAGSPCIGVGKTTSVPDHDFAFLPRPDGNDGKIDIGAFEYR